MTFSLQVLNERLRSSELFAAARYLSDPGHWPPKSIRENYRPVTPEEIALLERNGNSSSDWGTIHVTGDGPLDRIRQSRLEGPLWLHRTPGESGHPLAIEHATVICCVLGRGVQIIDVTCLDGFVVGGESVITRCGILLGVSGKGMLPLGDLAIAPSGGRRTLPMIPMVHSAEMAELLTTQWNGPEYHGLKEFWNSWVGAHAFPAGTIGSSCRINNLGSARGLFLGSGAVMDGVPVVERLLAISSEKAPVRIIASGMLKDVILHRGTEVTTGAQVEQAILCESSWARDNARVHSSIISPNSGVGGGELRSSFLGPFVGFSHQALCIATFWPGGKGNVSYGANIGSNHSGRAADQEHFAGEGVFYGLGASIKFPFNSIGAPYSLFSSGITCLPQKIEFPFSLINGPADTADFLSPALNEIMPGWALAKNLYGLLRSEEKFAARNHAHHERMDPRVFRREWVPMLERAMDRIRTALEGEACAGRIRGERIFTEKELPGLGKNFVTDVNLHAALRHYAWGLELIEFFEGAGTLTADRRRDIESRMVELLRENRRRDDERGDRIIPDYLPVHGTAGDDPLIRAWMSRTENSQA